MDFCKNHLLLTFPSCIVTSFKLTRRSFFSWYKNICCYGFDLHC